jgi:hypothetical protein
VTPSAAVLLDGAVDELLGGGRDVERRDLGRVRLVADGVHQVGGCEGERPDHLDLNARWVIQCPMVVFWLIGRVLPVSMTCVAWPAMHRLGHGADVSLRGATHGIDPFHFGFAAFGFDVVGCVVATESAF